MSERRWIRNSRLVALLLKYFARVHIWVYRRTNGRLGAKLLWFPAALLTTTGRKSDESRTTATLYLQYNDRVILPASFGGARGKSVVVPKPQGESRGAGADPGPAAAPQGPRRH